MNIIKFVTKDLGLVLSLVGLILAFYIYARSRFQEIARTAHDYSSGIMIFVRSKNVARDRLTGFMGNLDADLEVSAFLATLTRLTFCLDEFVRNLMPLGLSPVAYLNETQKLRPITRFLFLDRPMTLRQTDRLIIRVNHFLLESEQIWSFLMYRRALEIEVGRYYALTYNAPVVDEEAIRYQQARICKVVQSIGEEIRLLENDQLVSVERTLTSLRIH